VGPVGSDLEPLGGGAADREAEVVRTPVDGALADDAVPGANVTDVRADLHDLAGPLVTWNDGKDCTPMYNRLHIVDKEKP
jgi:hypothetical protein